MRCDETITVDTLGKVSAVLSPSPCTFSSDRRIKLQQHPGASCKPTTACPSGLPPPTHLLSILSFTPTHHPTHTPKLITPDTKLELVLYQLLIDLNFIFVYGTRIIITVVKSHT